MSSNLICLETLLVGYYLVKFVIMFLLLRTLTMLTFSLPLVHTFAYLALLPLTFVSSAASFMPCFFTKMLRNILSLEQISHACTMHLSTDVANHFIGACLLTRLPCSSVPPASSSCLHPVLVNQNVFSALLGEFPDLFCPTLCGETSKHGVFHHILTEGPTVWTKPRCLYPENLRAAKKEFSTMIQMGIVQPSQSQWASPLHLVPKSFGEWHPRVDYWKLNVHLILDCYPVSHLQDFSSSLAGIRIFSKVDLIRCHQIPVAPDVIFKTVITTPFGLIEFLKNASLGARTRSFWVIWCAWKGFLLFQGQGHPGFPKAEDS